MGRGVEGAVFKGRYFTPPWRQLIISKCFSIPQTIFFRFLLNKLYESGNNCANTVTNICVVMTSIYVIDFTYLLETSLWTQTTQLKSTKHAIPLLLLKHIYTYTSLIWNASCWLFSVNGGFHEKVIGIKWINNKSLFITTNVHIHVCTWHD